MRADYEIRIYDAFYNLLLILYEWQSLEYGRVTNDIGALKLVLDFSYFKYLAGKKDARIEVWRRPAGMQNFYLDGDTFYSLRRIDLRRDTKKQQTVTLYGYDTISLLSRRYVLYKAGSAQAQKTAAIDNMCKALITENFVTPTDTTRTMSGVSVRVNFSLAPSTTKGFSNRIVLDVLQDLAAESFSKGTYLAFDLVWYPNNQALVFQTYINQRGINRSSTAAGGITLDPDWNNLTDVVKSFDWTNEATFVQANGPGQDADRLAAPASDETRLAGTSIGRYEKVIDARNAADQASTQAEADAALRDYRAVVNYSVRTVDTDQVKFGREYGGGDIVTANVFGDSVDVRVDAYTIKVDSSGEDVTVKLQTAV